MCRKLSLLLPSLQHLIAKNVRAHCFSNFLLIMKNHFYGIRRKSKTTANLKTGCFNNIDSAVIISSVRKAV